ncbi:MAG: NAD(P)-dependent oxidoreductase [Devosia sp.]
MNLVQVAVIGGAGRLGRYVVDEIAPNHDVVVVDRVGAGSAHRHVRADITSIEDLMTALDGCDAVIHVAGIDGHIDAQAKDFFAVNVFGTFNVLEAVRRLGIGRVIVTSSTAATGLNATPDLTPAYLPIDEEHPLAPTDPYGIGKHLIEVMAEDFGTRHGIAVTCIRPTYIAFPELVPHLASSTIPDDPRLAQMFQEPLPRLRSYVDPGELARCYRLALALTEPGYQVFWANAADTFDARSTLEYATHIYGDLPRISQPERYRKHPQAAMIDCSKAERLLGWTHVKSWRDVLSATQD